MKSMILSIMLASFSSLFIAEAADLPPLPDSAHCSTLRADTQNRDHATYNWDKRFKATLLRNQKVKPVYVMIGDSITHFWGGEPADAHQRGNDSLQKCFKHQSFSNYGCGWDRTENVLWRIQHGLLDGISPKAAVILIGTNNLELNTAEEIVIGIDAITREIRAKLPQTKIVVLGILPRSPNANFKCTPEAVNKLAEKCFAGRPHLIYRDIGKAFLNADGKLNHSLFLDGLHPNAAGYNRMGEQIAPLLP